MQRVSSLIDMRDGDYRANDLHNYLRSNRVRSAPPEPAFTGVDSIELAKDIDIGGVQELLNAWK